MIVPKFDYSNNITQARFWGVVSGFLYALLCILNRRLVRTPMALVLTAGQNFVAGLLVAARGLGGRVAQPARMLLLAILGIVCTALAHYLFIKSLRYVRAQLASVVTALESVYAILLAVLFLGEIPSLRTLAGGSVILGAVVVATLGGTNVDRFTA